MTPLYRAAFHGHAAVAQVLLEAGADKEAKDKASEGAGAGARSSRLAS